MAVHQHASLLSTVLVSCSGDKDPQEAGYDDWDAVLEAATTLVESHAVYQKQASDVSWIRQRFELSQNHTSLHLQLFLQACMS